MPVKHCFLFALEVVPLEVGKAYDKLPAHCTLVHRFWLPFGHEELANRIRPVLDGTQPITYSIGNDIVLTETEVYELEDAAELRALHMKLHKALTEMGAEFTADEWVGTGYTPHISVREEHPLQQGSQQTSSAVYLIEVKIPSLPHKRLVRDKLGLGGS